MSEIVRISRWTGPALKNHFTRNETLLRLRNIGEDRRGKTANVSTSAAIVAARLAPFVSRHETAECGLGARGAARRFLVWGQPPFARNARASRFVCTQPQPAPRQQVVINSRRNNRLATAEGTTRAAKQRATAPGLVAVASISPRKHRLFRANDCLLFRVVLPRPAPKAVQTRETPSTPFVFTPSESENFRSRLGRARWRIE